MFTMGHARLVFTLALTGSAIWGQKWQVNIPLINWTAPQRWSAPVASGVGSLAAGATAPLQFVAITPCRLMDTRRSGIWRGVRAAGSGREHAANRPDPKLGLRSPLFGRVLAQFHRGTSRTTDLPVGVAGRRSV